MRCMTITSRLHQSQYTSGTSSSAPVGEVAPQLARVGRLAHEVQLVADGCSNSTTTSRGRSRVPVGKARSTIAAIRCSKPRPCRSPRGCRAAGSSPRPPCRRAAWRNAPGPRRRSPRARGSNEANTCAWAGRRRARGWPPFLPGNGGTLSWSPASSSATSSGIRSGRTDRSWPNFTNMGPRDSSARRRRSAARAPARAPEIHDAAVRAPSRPPRAGQVLVQAEAADRVDDAEEAQDSHGSADSTRPRRPAAVLEGYAM